MASLSFVLPGIGGHTGSYQREKACYFSFRDLVLLFIPFVVYTIVTGGGECKPYIWQVSGKTVAISITNAAVILQGRACV